MRYVLETTDSGTKPGILLQGLGVTLKISVLGLVFAACVTRGDIEEIKANQEKILEKVEKGGGAAKAGTR